MVNENYSEEIDLKIIGKKVVDIFNNKKKVFFLILKILLVISCLVFFKTIYMPSYKTNCILFSKTLKIDQLEKNIELYNNYLQSPDLNKIDDNLDKNFKKFGVVGIKLSEIKNKEDDLNDKADKYFSFNLSLIYSNKSNIDDISKLNSLLIEDIQKQNSNYNRVIQSRIRISSGIQELDSLIKVANEAGKSYTQNISSSKSSQLMVMNDIYTGINNLTAQKLNFQHELSMLEAKNIIFKSSPLLITNKVDYPWLIFFIAFFVWFVICFIWTSFLIIFKD